MSDFPNVPLDEERADTYYCRHCSAECINLETIQKHLASVHEIEYHAHRLIDFIRGDDLATEREELIRRFDLVTESLAGADDFVFECGGA